MAPQIIEQCVPFPDKCWSIGHRCYMVRREQILKAAEQVFENRPLAENWLTKPALGLDHRAPCSLLVNQLGYEHVRDLLIQLEYGVYL